MIVTDHASADAEAPAVSASADARRAAVSGLEGAFSEVFNQFRRMVAQAAERMSPGMLPATFKVLTTIDRNGPITLSALAERLTADKGQLSRSVSELEDLGFVARSADPRDGRVRLIEVTEVGRERLATARTPFEGRLGVVLQEWPIETIESLSDLLRALASGRIPQA